MQKISRGCDVVRLNAVFCETSKFTVHARSQDSKVPARMYSMYSFSIFLLRKRDPKNVMHKYISEVYSRVHFPVSTPQFVHICASTTNKLSDLNAITGEDSQNARSLLVVDISGSFTLVLLPHLV